MPIISIAYKKPVSKLLHYLTIRNNVIVYFLVIACVLHIFVGLKLMVKNADIYVISRPRALDLTVVGFLKNSYR